MRPIRVVDELAARLPRRARLPLAFFAACVLAITALAWSDTHSGDEFDFARWERTTITNKWLHLLGTPFRDDLDADDAIARYFALDDYSSEEARELENVVEANIEGRIDHVLGELGIEGRIPLPGSVFPPVDIELASSPRALVISPRDHVELIGAQLLRPDLTLDDAIALEAISEQDESRSALVVGTGGVATYPAVVNQGSNYASTVSTAAHEWVHHYLTFYELGLRYNSSSDMRTINETVADIAGDEIAAIVIERFGDPTKSDAPPAARTGPYPGKPESPAVDRNELLRKLRLEVDGLLEAGRVQQAESRMEQLRLELCGAGYCLQRINQAYFAWYGTYAAREDSVDSLGPQLWELRERKGSLQSFLAAVRGIGSRAQVDQLLDQSAFQGAVGS